MKKTKLLFPILILVLLMPFAIKAAENDCEKVNSNSEKTIEIKIQQEITNKEKLSLEDKEQAKFTYKILDLEDNVLAETTNDEEGNITFDCFTVNRSNIGNYKLYKIVMENPNNTLFDYDPYIIYFSVRPNYTNGLLDPIIAYYKDDGDDSPERYGLSYKGTVFHATDEELQGKAYAVIDTDTGIMTFFRDEEGKYTNRQEIGNKTYYTGFEESNIFGWDGERNKYNNVTKIVFKDAIKPIEIKSWFRYFSELEEADLSKLDTSLVSDMSWLFTYCYKLKKVDISTMDTTNTQHINYMFQNTQIEYFDLSYWNLNPNYGRYDFFMGESFSRNPKLKYLNISNFGDWSSSNDFFRLPCLEKIVLGANYGFQNTSLDDTTNYPIWYSPTKNKMYNSNNFNSADSQFAGDIAGYYIRPMCTTTASFKINYNPPETEDSTNATDTLTNPTDTLTNPHDTLINPNTKTEIYIIIALVILSLSSITYVVSIGKKKNNK